VTAIRSSLAALSSSALNAEEIETLRHKAWKSGFLTISIRDDRLTWPDRELLMQIGKRIYGFSPSQS
jgi:hypothetical protein